MMGAALGTALRHMNGKRVIEKGHAESCKAIADKQQKPQPLSAQRTDSGQRLGNTEKKREKEEKSAANTKRQTVCSRREHLKKRMGSFARKFFQPGRSEAVIASTRTSERWAAVSC